MSDEQQIDTAGAVAAYLNPQQDQPARAARAAMTIAADSNPDFEAELRRVSERTGVPLDSARAHPEEVKRQAALQAHDFDALARQYPDTTKFLADPDNARISHDDVANLSATESTIGPIRGPKPTFWTYATGLMKSLPQGAAMAREGIRLQLADLFGQDAVRADAQSKYSQLSLEQDVAAPSFEGSTARGVYSGLTSTVRAAPGLVASLITRSPTPMLATIGLQTEADAYGKYRNRGAAPVDALVGGLGEGTVEVATELLPMSFLVKNLGKTGAGHFLTGLLAREVPGEQIATLAQDAIDTAIANPDKTWGQYLAERPDAAYQTLLATITQAGLMEGGNVALQRVQGRSQEAQRAGDVGTALEQFNKLAEASKVRERDAGTAQQFFHSLMQDGRDTVWITPKALAESGMLEQISQALPDVAAQLEQAANTGADIRLSVPDLIAHLAGPELEQSIIPHLSEEPGGFTKTSAESYLNSGAAIELAEEVKRTLDGKQHDDAFTASREAVSASMLEQLNTAGRFAPAVNQAYASMVGNFYAVQAARMGITPEEMAARYPLQIRAEAMPGARTLDQAGAYQPELIVQHNLTEGNLLHAHKLGGMAVPSLAITKASQPLHGFGEISLLGSKEMIDPKKADNKVFGADIYSPRYPSIGHKVDKPVLKSLNAALKPYYGKFGGRELHASELGNDVVGSLTDLSVVKAAALAEMGVDVEPVMKDGKVDNWASERALRDAVHANDAYGKVEAFARGLLEKAGAPERIFTGYSRSGNQTFVPHTLENVIKILKKELRGGENFNYGVGTVRSKFTPQFKSIDQIIKNKDKLVDSATFEKVKEEIGKEFDGQVTALKPFHASSNTFGFSDTVAMMMSDSAKSGVPRALEMNGFKDVPAAEQKAIAEFLNKLRTLPTEYFEAKALRAVPLGEFKTAVVPEGTSQAVLAALKENGITDVRTYKKGDEADRAAQIQQADHLLFQSSDGARGSLTFGDDITQTPSVITLLQHADLSTFLHESGHFFLEVLNDMASRPDAPADIAADMDATLAWFGITGNEQADGGAQGGTVEQPAFHGSPYKFDKFTVDHIGKGEGNQAFGWGLYFAGNKAIAEYYRKMLTSLEGADGKPADMSGLSNQAQKFINEQLAIGSEPAAIAAEAQRTAAQAEIWDQQDVRKGQPATRTAYSEAMREVAAFIGDKKRATGQLYEVEVPERDQMVQWDKPLSEQPDHVKAALRAIFEEHVGWTSFDEYAEESGADYKEMKDNVLESLSEREISELMAKHGVKGIAYLDGLSRDQGDGSFNYVVFDDATVNILNTFYQGGENGHRGDLPPGRTPRDVWNAMSLEQKRPYHEQFARGFEAYLFEGRAPTADLASLFSRFRSWLVNVYKSLTSLNVELTPEVRGVFDRMLASSDAIAQAERDLALAGMFGTRPDFMTDEEWAAYRLLSVRSTEEATRDLETRSLKDMKWLGNAKSKMLRALQKEANFKRQQIDNEVRKEVMSQPVYQAWQFLTLRGSDSTRAWPSPEFKLDPKHVDTRIDNLYTAIAKMGGLNRDEVKSKWGVDHRDMPASNVFGMPILRKSGGLSIDRMAEKLTEEHYLDSHDLAEFEDKFDRQRGGQEQRSWEYQYSNGERAPVDPVGDSNYHGKLSTKMLRHMYGEDMFGAEPDVVRKLIDYRMTSTENGLDPDIVAEMLGGFDSGRALVDALVAADKPSTVINKLVDQRMLERHGDLIDEAAIDRAVNEALHQKAHIRFVQTEMTALQKAAGKPAVLAKAAQAYAEQIVRRTPINELRPDRFTSAAKRAGHNADKAFKAGDIQKAAAEKQTQLINVYAAKAALDARNEVEKTMVRFKTITNGNNETVAKTRDLDMVMATRAILAEYGVGTRGAKATEYLAKVEAYDPAMAAVLRDRIDASTENARPLRELTIEQLGALRDEIESLWFLARRSRQMEVDGDLLDREEIQGALVARLDEIGIPAEAPGSKHAITPGEVSLSRLQSLRASLRRVEAWAGAKDGNEAMGPFRKFIWNTIKDRADAYRMDKARYLKAYRALLDGVAPTLSQVKIAAPELNYTFGFDKGGMGKVELLHALLHTGNIGNKKKLLLGRQWATENVDGSLNTDRWDSFVERMIREGTLTRADFDFAQGVWDLLEQMKPAAQKAHREVFGRYFDEVTANPFTVSLRDASGAPVKVDYRGGYVPAIADSRIVTDAKTRAIMEDEAATLMNALPATSKGFTKSRVEYNRPLLLDLRLLAQHIDKVLLFSHLEQPVRDVRRVLGHSSVAKPLHLVDPAAYDGLLIPWLNRTARQQVETKVDGSNGLMRFFSVTRQRAGMAAMFANVSNTVQQITGFSMAALKVKPSYLLSASADFIRSPREMAQAVAEASPYMANRMDNEVEAMTGAINDILLNPGVYEKAVGWTTKHTYFLQSAMDNVMGPIIWHGAYNQAIETAPAGLTDEGLQRYARQLADSAVRETQGSTLPEDISRIETGNAFVRMFTQFAGYFNMQANLLGTEFAKVAQDTGLRKGMGRGFYILMFGFLVPAWGAQAIALAFRGGPDDEDKDGGYLDDWLAQTFGWGTLRAATALVPVVGQTANALANTFNKKPYDDKISTGPAISMIESAVSVPSDVYKLATGTGSGTRTVRDVATLVSLALGVPATAVARPISYLTDVNTGKAKPTGAVDVTRGLVTGAASPASKGR